MAPLPLGIVSGSAASIPFSATGGSITVDSDGYRHHIFNASGSLQVTPGSSNSDVKILLVNGGKTGGTVSSDGVGIYGGIGGYGGTWIQRDATVSGNVSVSVAGSGGTSGASGGISLGTIRYRINDYTYAPPSSNGFGGMLNRGWPSGFTTTNARGTRTGLSLKPPPPSGISIYSNVAQLPTNFPGQGGGGGAYYVPTAQEALPNGGGVSGGGAGARGLTQTPGASGAANTGGGGGGGGARATSYSPPPDGEEEGGGFTFSSLSPGAGGSGFVVISYPIQA